MSLDKRRTIAQLRCGCLPLEIELGRYRNPKIPLDQRICNLCNTGTEDETHFLTTCPALRSNIILFGVSETEDLSIVSDVLKVAAGTKVAIKDMFRLGKKPRRPLTRGKQSGDFATGDESSLSSHQDKPARPRPILVKLSCPWDRRVILAGKMKLSESEGMENYFLQPDLSLEERQKRRADYLARKSLRNVARVSPGNV